MKHFALFYDFVPDFREKRVPFRAVHLEHCNAAVAREELQVAGAFAEDPPGSMLIFKAESPDLVEASRAPIRMWSMAWRWVSACGSGRRLSAPTR